MQYMHGHSEKESRATHSTYENWQFALCDAYFSVDIGRAHHTAIHIAHGGCRVCRQSFCSFATVLCCYVMLLLIWPAAYAAAAVNVSRPHQRATTSSVAQLKAMSPVQCTRLCVCVCVATVAWRCHCHCNISPLNLIFYSCNIVQN